jgi:hypothetical protein
MVLTVSGNVQRFSVAYCGKSTLSSNVSKICPLEGLPVTEDCAVGVFSSIVGVCLIEAPPAPIGWVAVAADKSIGFRLSFSSLDCALCVSDRVDWESMVCFICSATLLYFGPTRVGGHHVSRACPYCTASYRLVLSHIRSSKIAGPAR